MIESLDALSTLLVSSLPSNSSPTLASVAAADNWGANLAALASTQPEVAALVTDEMVLGEWTYGRDGALTIFDETAGWWAGCSIPRRAGQAMLKTLDAKGNLSVFLLPPHAAH